MDIIFEYHDVMKSESLETLATEKLDKIGHKYEMVIRADVFFKTENTSSDKTGKICAIRLSLPGPQVFAESSKENFMVAISQTTSEIEKQLRKRKEKMQAH